MPVTIVDYGVGNIGALLNMLETIGVEAVASCDHAVIEKADKLILPGVGAFDTAMNNLRARNLIGPLKTAVKDRGAAVLGICLGMQLLANDSEEGREKGLGWIDASVVKLNPKHPETKVPHVGWSDIHPQKASPLFPHGAPSERFYFTHSYQVSCRSTADVLATIDYDESPVCVAVSHANVHGVQFHPEKSHRFGMRLLKSFANA